MWWVALGQYKVVFNGTYGPYGKFEDQNLNYSLFFNLLKSMRSVLDTISYFNILKLILLSISICMIPKKLN